MGRQPTDMAATQLVRLNWEKWTGGYELKLCERPSSADLGLWIDAFIPGCDVVARRDQPCGKTKIYQEFLPETDIFVDFLNAPRTRDGLLKFVNKWGLLLKGDSMDLGYFLNRQREFRKVQDIGERFQKYKRAADRKALSDAIGNDGVAKLKATLDLKLRRYTPQIALEASNPMQFFRVCLFHSAFVAPLVVSCEAGCGQFVRLTPLGRPNSFCSDACRQRISRARRKARSNF
jgi:hypothetical protein